MSDLRWICQKNSTAIIAIMRAANRPDADKSDVSVHERQNNPDLAQDYPFWALYPNSHPTPQGVYTNLFLPALNLGTLYSLLPDCTCLLVYGLLTATFVIIPLLSSAQPSSNSSNTFHLLQILTPFGAPSTGLTKNQQPSQPLSIVSSIVTPLRPKLMHLINLLKTF